MKFMEVCCSRLTQEEVVGDEDTHKSVVLRLRGGAGPGEANPVIDGKS